MKILSYNKCFVSLRPNCSSAAELALRRIYCMIEFSLFLSLAGFEGEVRMLLLTLIVISDMILCFLNFVSFSLDKCHICIIIQYIKFLYIEI